jgi:hypothetical protein
MKTRTIRAAQLICALAILPHAHAQNEEDALRIGTLMPGGTGRSAGMANAFGAVGADPASIGINPAGFGLYRTSELSLTPLVEVNDAKATTYGTATGDTQTRFAIGNLALILNTPSNGGDWRSGTFGVVMDRQQSHNRRVQANGTRVPSTFLESLAIDAEGIGNDAVHDALPFTSGLAWETFAINPLDPDDSLGTSYLPAIPFGELTDQEHSMVSRDYFSPFTRSTTYSSTRMRPQCSHTMIFLWLLMSSWRWGGMALKQPPQSHARTGTTARPLRALLRMRR